MPVSGEYVCKMVLRGRKREVSGLDTAGAYRAKTRNLYPGHAPKYTPVQECHGPSIEECLERRNGMYEGTKDRCSH